MGLIHELLPKVMADIDYIGKDQRNKVQNYPFRGIDDALNHGNPVLARHGVSVGVSVRDYKTKAWEQDGKGGYKQRVFRVTLLMAVTFYAPDGSSLENILAGEAIDYGGDKATNKAMAAALKYGLFFGLMIPVERQAVDDSDRTPVDEVPYQHREPEPTANGDHPKDAASLYTRAEAKIDNAVTIEDLNKCQERVDTLVRSGDFTAAEGNKLGAKINARARRISGREPANS